MMQSFVQFITKNILRVEPKLVVHGINDKEARILEAYIERCLAQGITRAQATRLWVEQKQDDLYTIQMYGDYLPSDHPDLTRVVWIEEIW